MRYRLRTLLILVGVLPPAIAALVAIGQDSGQLVGVNDPLVWIGATAWVVLFIRFAIQSPASAAP